MAYFSKFGGLWIDDTDADAVAGQLACIGDSSLRDRMARFIRDGYVIIEQAVDDTVIDAYLREYEVAAATPGALRIEAGDGSGQQPFVLQKALIPGAKVLDTVMLTPHGQDLCFAPLVSRFLMALFGEPALAFQSLHFEVGSSQAVHQDTAYVVVKDAPLRLAACWIALQDVTPGSGELIYYPAGHRIPDHPYAGGISKHWNPQRDGHAPHKEHLRSLTRQIQSRGLPERRFLARKGDALLWHADLPHGGSAITAGGPRRSLVTHYCPGSLAPHFVDFVPTAWRQKVPARDCHAFMSLYFPPERLGLSTLRMDRDGQKRAAGEAAAELVKDGMAVGLGTGSTAYFAIEALIRRVREGLQIVAIPTSERSGAQARAGGIPLTDFTKHPRLDLTIDGADEIQRDTLSLIKGLGGALLREKIVAAASERLVIVADGQKLVERLGLTAPLPVEVVPFGWETTVTRLRQFGTAPVLRQDGDRAFRTDGGNLILDCAFGAIDEPARLEQTLRQVTGVVDVGLFIGMASLVLVADENGVCELVATR